MVMSLRVFGKESRRNQEQLSKYCDQEYKWIHSTKGTSLNPHAYKIIYPIQGPNDLNQSSAAIYFANHSPTNHSVVIKITDLESEESFQLLLNEIDNFRKVRHSNLLPLLATFVRDGQLWNVMTSAQYGSVDIWSKPSGLPELAIAFIIKDVLAGLNYLHKRGFIHRAVCGSHILVNTNGSCMLTGLKYSTTVLQEGRWQRSIFQYPKDSVRLLNYLAPEVLEQNLLGYNSKSDIYSVGIVCCELANGCIPFEDIALTEMLLDKLTGNFPRPLDSTCEEIRNFPCEDLLPEVKEKYETYKTRTFSSSFHKFTIELCLRYDRFTRPTAADLLTHSFIKQAKKSHHTLLGVLKANKTRHTAAQLETHNSIWNNFLQSDTTTVASLLTPTEPTSDNVEWDI